LKAELAAAERVANDKKRKAKGLPIEEVEEIGLDKRIEGANGVEDEESVKRRKVLEEALRLDKDDSGDDDIEEVNGDGKGKGKAVVEDRDEDEDDDDDE